MARDEAAALARSQQPPSADGAGGTTPTQPPRATVLNVSEDRAARATVTRLLRGAGLDVKEATTGAEALRLVAEQPDLIVLDVHLPDLDGVEVCRRLKADPATSALPVLHLSARSVPLGDKADGLPEEAAAGGDLVPPVKPSELVATVQGLLWLRQAERAKASAEAAAQVSAERVAQLTRELEALERLTGRSAATSATAQVLGDRPLRESHPDLFCQAVADSERLLDLALEQREYQVAHPVSEGLRALADQVGLLQAGPRDVVDLYGAALKGKTAGVPPRKARVYIEEGRLLVLELMGHLASYYRLRALGAGRSPSTTEPARPGAP